MSASSSSRGLHIALWVLQGLLAAVFLMSGSMKSFSPPEELVKNGLAWVEGTPMALVRFIGISQVLGALGLILPSVLRIKPSLSALAGAGLALVMVLAALFHVSRGEMAALPTNVVLGGLAAFVAYGRFKKAPISPR